MANIIKQAARISHHTLADQQYSNVIFTVPNGEDFLNDNWLVTDLALSEFGINEVDKKLYIRIGNTIKEINLGLELVPDNITLHLNTNDELEVIVSNFKTSELTNDLGFITISDVPSDINQLNDSSNLLFSGVYTDLINKPVNLSEFNNDENYIKVDEIPVDGVTIDYNNQNKLEVLTTTSLSDGDAINIDNSDKINVKVDNNKIKIVNDELTVDVSSLNIPTDINQLNDSSNLLFSGYYTDLINKPVNLSEFNNDENYIKADEIPVDGVTIDYNNQNKLEVLTTSLSDGDAINIDNSDKINVKVDNNKIKIVNDELTVDVSSLNIPSDINDLTDNSNLIPTDLNQLSDSSGLIPTDISDLSDTTNVIPTNNNQLTNGAGYVTTDTTYTAGTNVQISGGNVISATDTTYSDLSEFNNDEGFIKKDYVNILDVQTRAVNFTLALSDIGKLNVVTGSITITIPTNAIVDFEIGTKLEFLTVSSTITISASSGVLLNSQDGNKKPIQYTGFTLIKTGTDTWYLLGALEA